jgi:hypothetical protein
MVHTATKSFQRVKAPTYTFRVLSKPVDFLAPPPPQYDVVLPTLHLSTIHLHAGHAIGRRSSKQDMKVNRKRNKQRVFNYRI